MHIAIKAGDKYYRATVTAAWAAAHDNGALISCGLIVGAAGFTPNMLAGLIRRKKAVEITEEQWIHSGCQSSCRIRGDKECHW